MPEFVSHFLDYVIASIFLEVSPPPGAFVSCPSQKQPGELFPFRRRLCFILECLVFIQRRDLLSASLPETQYVVHSFERIRGEKWF